MIDQPDLRAVLVHRLEAGQREWRDVVTGFAQHPGDLIPRPGAEPETGNEYECRHAPHATINTGQIPPGLGGPIIGRSIIARPTARVLALLEILQAGGGYTLADLAGRLGVDERTIRRYAAHLADLGIPVEARRGRYGGYRLASGYKLPPLMLTDEEAVAVILGLVAADRAGLTTAEGAAAESATAKIRRVLPAALARRIDSLLATVDFTAPARESAPPGIEVLLVLADAARHRQPVSIAYTTWRGQSGERRLDPYGLVFHAGRWYVTGHDHNRAAVRTFRLDRIGSARPTEGRFDIPAGFDPTAQVVSGLAAVPYAYDISVLLHTTLAQARRRIPPSVGTLTEVSGGVRLTTRVERPDGAAQMLAGLGWPFTIDRPEALKDEVRALAARLLAGADTGTAATRTDAEASTDADADVPTLGSAVQGRPRRRG